MKNTKKQIILIISFAALVLIIGVVIIGWCNLTFFSNTSEDKQCLSENEKDFLLDYLSQFKVEAVASGANETETTRIVQKHQLMEDYRTCVNAMASNTLTEAEYNEHYEQLMSLANKLLLLEPDKNEEQEFELLLRQLLLKLKDERYYCEVYGNQYVSGCNIDIVSLDQSITEIKTLLESYIRKEITIEAAKNAYMECYSLIEKGSPRIYNLLSSP